MGMGEERLRRPLGYELVWRASRVWRGWGMRGAEWSRCGQGVLLEGGPTLWKLTSALNLYDWQKWSTVARVDPVLPIAQLWSRRGTLASSRHAPSTLGKVGCGMQQLGGRARETAAAVLYSALRSRGIDGRSTLRRYRVLCCTRGLKAPVPCGTSTHSGALTIRHPCPCLDGRCLTHARDHQIRRHLRITALYPSPLRAGLWKRARVHARARVQALVSEVECGCASKACFCAIPRAASHAAALRASMR